MSRSRNLTRERVVEVAANLVNDAGNIDAIMLKDVAKALNIRVPSLYNHVKGQTGLRQQLRLYALNNLIRAFRESMAGKIGREALEAAAHAYRTYALANPGLYPIILEGDPVDESDEANRIKGEMLTLFTLVLGSYGLSGDDAHHAVRALRSLLHGFVSLELANGFAMALDVDDSFNRLLALYLQGISAIS